MPLASVTSTLGYQVRWLSDDDSASTQGVNLSVDNCDPAATSCSVTQPVSDRASLGKAITYSGEADPNIYQGWIITAHNPAGGADQVWHQDSSRRVTSYGDGSGVWIYAYARQVNGTDIITTNTVADPNGHKRSVTTHVGQATPQPITDCTDANGDGVMSSNECTTYEFVAVTSDPPLVAKITRPEGDRTQYSYDARGNVTSVATVSADGSVSTTIQAGYDSGCSNPKTCNKPLWVRDANGNQTDFTWSPDHGGMLTTTQPAQPNGVRPRTRYFYQQQQATYYQNGSLQAGPPVWLLIYTGRCVTAATCDWTGDERAAWFGYDANNLMPTWFQKGAGDGSFTASWAKTYDTAGNLLTATDLNGYATRYRYDAARQLVGVVGPDPDGSGGPLKNRAIRYSYDGQGLLTTVEQGTVNSQSDADWSGFTALANHSYHYDSVGRLDWDWVIGPSAQANLTQHGYDAAGRLLCATVRMNPASWGSSPADACQLAPQGSFGPDLITRYGYDNADRPTSITTGYGTADQRTAQTQVYGADGEVLSQTDGKGQRTSYAYDALNRLSVIRHPDPANVGQSSATDYESFGYDAAGNLTSGRLRDGTPVGYSYDALNRVTYDSRTSISYAYDNLGRVVSASGGGQTLSYGYDALGRLTSQGGPLGTVTSQYDLAGDRTRLTWPDGFSVAYGYDTVGEMIAAYEGTLWSGTLLYSYG